MKNNLVQTAVRLPREMLDRLKGGEGGASEQIRQRIERTFEDDAYDPETRELAAAVMWIADQINRDTGSSWHLKPKAREALAVALQTYLEITKPVPRHALQRRSVDPPGVTDLFDDSIGDPQTVGRVVASHYVQFKAALQKSNREMLQLHKGEKS